MSCSCHTSPHHAPTPRTVERVGVAVRTVLSTAGTVLGPASAALGTVSEVLCAVPGTVGAVPGVLLGNSRHGTGVVGAGGQAAALGCLFVMPAENSLPVGRFAALMERNRTPDDRLNINCKALLEVPPHAQFSHLHTNAGMHTQPHKAGVYLFVRSPCVPL